MQIKKKNNSPKICQYLEQGKPYLACIKKFDKEKTTLLNSQNKEITVSSNRIEYIPGRIPIQFSHNNQILLYLKGLTIESEKIKKTIKLEDIWNKYKDSKNDIKLEHIQKFLFKNTNIANYLGLKWALHEDKYFFKKTKSGYTARKANSIEEIKKQVEIEEKAAQDIEKWITQLNNKENLDQKLIEILEKTAANGSKFSQSNIAENLISAVSKEFKIQDNKKIQDKSFELLVKLGLFSKHQNLTPIKLERNLYFCDQDLKSAEEISNNKEIDDRIDYTHLNSYTIDAEDTNDYDDALSLEQTESGYIVRIHISDVASYIEKDSHLWKLAEIRAASIYTADNYYPMLPHVLSEKHFSLVKGETKPCITLSAYFSKDLEETKFDIEQSIIKVSHRLSYNQVDSGLKQNQVPEEIKKLLEIAKKLEEKRIQKGAKILPKREMTPIIDESGVVGISNIDEDTDSRKIISEMMIYANYKFALYANKNEIPFYYKTQEKPESLDFSKIPEGPALEYALRGVMKRSIFNLQAGEHSGLGLECYAQCSSPIRRFSDLINQHQIVSFLNQKDLISKEKLESNSEKIGSRISEVIYIQRNRHNYWLLQYLKQQNLNIVNATVIKNAHNKTIAELDNLIFFCQFRKAKNSKLKIGQRVKLKVEAIRPKYNFIRLIQLSDS